MQNLMPQLQNENKNNKNKKKKKTRTRKNKTSVSYIATLTLAFLHLKFNFNYTFTHKDTREILLVFSQYNKKKKITEREKIKSNWLQCYTRTYSSNNTIQHACMHACYMGFY